MRVAFYARHSDSELQNDKSSLDQLALLRRTSDARQWRQVVVYTDEGISGSSIANRPGLQALLRDAARGMFDVVLVEALDRVSRDQEGTALLRGDQGENSATIRMRMDRVAVT